MAKPSDAQADLRSLHNLITEAATVVSTADLPQRRGQRLTELLKSAIALTEHLIETPPAVALGQRGGLKTAERHGGSEYFRQLAAQRKTHSGGRPKKEKREA
jgi:hypothetical protein